MSTKITDTTTERTGGWVETLSSQTPCPQDITCCGNEIPAPPSDGEWHESTCKTCKTKWTRRRTPPR